MIKKLIIPLLLIVLALAVSGCTQGPVGHSFDWTNAVSEDFLNKGITQYFKIIPGGKEEATAFGFAEDVNPEKTFGASASSDYSLSDGINEYIFSFSGENEAKTSFEKFKTKLLLPEELSKSSTYKIEKVKIAEEIAYKIHSDPIIGIVFQRDRFIFVIFGTNSYLIENLAKWTVEKYTGVKEPKITPIETLYQK